MAELVRVRLAGGVEKNLGAAYAKAHNLEVLDEPTTNKDGTLRAATREGRRIKRRTTVAKSAAAKKKAAASDSAKTEKEENR